MISIESQVESAIVTTKEIFIETKKNSFINRKMLIKVPANQRAYEWNRRNLEDFFNDISNMYLNPDQEPYFMGNIIFDYVQRFNREHLEVQDGQQRITTVVLFYAALKKFLKAYYSFSRTDLKTFESGQEIEEKLQELDGICDDVLLYPKEYQNSGDPKYNFVSGISHELFNELIDFSTNNDDVMMFNNQKIIEVNQSGDVSRHGALSRNYNQRDLKYVDINILEAFVYFYNEFYKSWKEFPMKKRVKSNNEENPNVNYKTIFDSNKGIDIYEYSKYLYEKVIFNALRLKEPFSQKKFSIFETINARGQQLKEADKLKNHILSKIDEQNPQNSQALNKALRLWGEIVQNTDTHIEDFVNDMVVLEIHSYRARIGKKNITDPTIQNTYNEFKRQYVDKYDGDLNYNRLIVRWAEYSKYYNNIVSAKETGLEGNQFLNSLEILKKEFKISRILQMQIWKMHNQRFKVKQYFHALVILYVLSIILKVNDTYQRASKVRSRLLYLMRDYDLFDIKQIPGFSTDNISNLLLKFYEELKDPNSVSGQREYLKAEVLKRKLRNSLSLDESIAKYILITFENNSLDVTRLMSTNQETTYHLEHICPQSPDKNSPEHQFKSSQEFDKVIQSIGNGLIISKELNEKCKNSPISEKIVYYKDAKNKTKMLEDFLEYIREHQFSGEGIKNHIKKRTSHLADEIYQSEIFSVDKMLNSKTK